MLNKFVNFKNFLLVLGAKAYFVNIVDSENDNLSEWRRNMSLSRNILNYDMPIDHRKMLEYLTEFSERYEFLGITSLGESIMGRNIPLITLGEGKKSILYVGAHHGMEWITSALLLRFINEYCELVKNKSRIFSYEMEYIFSSKTIYVIPMLNPDGVDYQINGVDKDNILYERLLRMNKGSEDFSRWQANARGVDLNHNYNCGFAEYKRLELENDITEGAPTRYSGNMPESEPEVASLCNFLRFNEDIKMVLTLHSQGEEIYYMGGGKALPRTRQIANSLARMSGYKLCVADGMAAYGGLTDWCVAELGRPSFTIECGKGENPLPISDNFKIYTRLREMLFTAPSFC